MSATGPTAAASADLTPTPKGALDIRLTVAPLAAFLLLILSTLYADAEGHHCRSRMCLGAQGSKLKPSYKGCKKLHPGRGSARATCEIARAARHWHQSRSFMRSLAACESRYNWRAHNPSGASGLFQFMPSTFASTPYRHRSLWHPKWNAMAAGWMLSVGRRAEWAC